MFCHICNSKRHLFHLQSSSSNALHSPRSQGCCKRNSTSEPGARAKGTPMSTLQLTGCLGTFLRGKPWWLHVSHKVWSFIWDEISISHHKPMIPMYSYAFKANSISTQHKLAWFQIDSWGSTAKCAQNPRSLHIWCGHALTCRWDDRLTLWLRW